MIAGAVLHGFLYRSLYHLFSLAYFSLFLPSKTIGQRMLFIKDQRKLPALLPLKVLMLPMVEKSSAIRAVMNFSLSLVEVRLLAVKLIALNVGIK
jgi:hypothetical protein